jgi:outer membrane protein assembly factor BamB
MNPRAWRIGVLLVVSCLSMAADWPQFLGPNRNGISTETGLLRTWPKKGPPLLWEKPVGAGFSGPAIAGDRLILFHRVDNDEVVECLDAGTGKERWKFAYRTQYQDEFGMDEGPRATPLIAGQRLYTLGAEGELHCLDLETGMKIWQRSVNTDFAVRKGFFGVGTSPLLDGNLLCVNVGGKGAGIVAFNKDSGETVWKATDHEASYSSPVAATLAGQRRLIFFTREGIVFLNPASGTVEYSKHWRARLSASVNAASPVVVGDDVFFSACYGTGAILLHVGKDGVEEVWKGDEIMSNHYGTCIAHEGHLYGFDGRQEGGAHLRCIELKTGKICWTSEDAACGSMILAEGRLIILTEKGELVLADATPEAYKERARAPLLTRDCRGQIALANGRLYARDPKRLGCWNLKAAAR